MEDGMRRYGMAFFVAVALLASGCTRPEGAKRVLEGAGYTNVTAGGFGWLSCHKDDWFRTKFVATGPTGNPVSGCVCEGLLFKNSTIRFE
jgi:hypothetical protein